MTAKRKPYNDESLMRALDVAVEKDIIGRWSPPEQYRGGRSTWLIYLNDPHGIPAEFTAAQVYAFCVALGHCAALIAREGV